MDEQNQLQEKIYSLVLDFISYQPRTEREVLNKLSRLYKREKLNESEIQEITQDIMDRLKNVDLIDDKKYAQEYVSSIKNSSKLKNTLNITKFLLKKGISKELIEYALQDLSEDYDYEIAYKEGEKKLKTLRNLTLPQKRKKLLTFLMGKGYRADISYSVVDTLLQVK